MPVSTTHAAGQPITAVDMNALAALVNSLEATANAVVSLSRAPAGSRLAAPLNGSLNTSATTARPSTRTDIFFDWWSTVQPNNMLPGDTWDAPA